VPDLALLPILERRNAPSSIYESRGATIGPIIRGRLPGELLAGVGKPLFGVPVDLHPSYQRGMIERLLPQRSRIRSLADDEAKLGGHDVAVVQDTALGVVAEMRDGPHF